MLGVNGDARGAHRFGAYDGREVVERLLANAVDCDERRRGGGAGLFDGEADGRAEEFLFLLVLCAQVYAIVAGDHAVGEYCDVGNGDVAGLSGQSDVEIHERSAVAEHFDAEVVYADVPLAVRNHFVQFAFERHRHVDARVRRPNIRFTGVDCDMIAVLAAVLVRQRD